MYKEFVKIFGICKQLPYNLVDEQGNITRRGLVLKFSDLEVVALSLDVESESIENEK